MVGNAIERLIALDWLARRIKREMAEARSEVEEHYHDRMTHEVNDRGEPVRSFRYYVGGRKLASFWFPVSKEVPERHTQRARCYDWDAAFEDDNDDFAEWLGRYVKAHIGELAEQYVTETGDTLDGVTVVDEVTPAKPGHVKGMSFKPDKSNVEEYMAPLLSGSVVGLLREQQKE